MRKPYSTALVSSILASAVVEVINETAEKVVEEYFKGGGKGPPPRVPKPVKKVEASTVS